MFLARLIIHIVNSGRLFLERRAGRVLIYVESAHSTVNERQMVAALAASDMRHRYVLPVRAGLSSDDRLVFGVVCDDSDLTLQSLHTTLDQLMKLHADIENRAA